MRKEGSQPTERRRGEPAALTGKTGTLAVRPVLLVLLLIVIIVTREIGAHDLEARARREGQEIVVEAYFPDDRSPAPDLRVTVTGPDGAEVARGETDERGRFRFPFPEPSPATGLRVRVRDALGHAAEAVFRETSGDDSRTDGASSETRRKPNRESDHRWTRGLRILTGILAIVGLTLLASRIARRRKGAS